MNYEKFVLSQIEYYRDVVKAEQNFNFGISHATDMNTDLRLITDYYRNDNFFKIVLLGNLYYERTYFAGTPSIRKYLLRI